MPRQARMRKRFRRAASSVEYLFVLAALVSVLILGVALLPGVMLASYQDAVQGMTKQGGPLKVRKVFRNEELRRKERR